MSIMERIIQRAKNDKKHIVLAEGNDLRVLKAAGMVVQQGIARVTVLGDEAEIAKQGIDLTGVSIVNPKTSEKLENYAELFYELRKNKGMTLENARATLIKDPLYFGTLMVKAGDADGMVAGAINATSNVIRPALQIIKAAKGISSVSSCFIIDSPKRQYGDNGVLMFGDCGLIIDPSSEELASIAITTARTGKVLAEMEQPRVALLSFSTKGSAKHEKIDKVTAALEIAKNADPELLVDGELQADAALVPEVGKLKAPGSAVAGKANVLVFPDLNAGNIGYKLTQRFGGANAYGPIIQGLAKPVNDLSRGCVAEDIVGVVAVTCVQAQNV